MPGFNPGVVELLMRRAVKGLAVDIMNIETGDRIPAYPFHQGWQVTGGWGLEGVANLAKVAETGAVLVVGRLPVETATGMPVRLSAMF